MIFDRPLLTDGNFSARANDLKDPQLAVTWLEAFCRGLGHEQRQMAEAVIAEWALSDDEATRFDALALIQRLSMRSCATALQSLAKRLALRPGPGPRYEIARVEQILRELGT